jgi:hypothetical protein
LDKQKEKCIFVWNKSGKNEDINKQEAPAVRQRSRIITKKTDSRAISGLREKRLNGM